MRSRPLAILLSVVVLISTLFCVTSSASGTENLVDSDLSNWEVIDSDFSIGIYSKSDIYRLSAKSSGEYFLGLIYDLPNFTAGHSYTLKFKLPSASDIVSSWGVNFSDDLLKSYYNNSTLFIGYGFLSADGTSVDTQVILYEFNSSNISKYVGKNLSTSFVAGSASGRPVLYIGIVTNDTNTHFFYLSDFVLIDNDDNSGQIKGILGMLHSLRWDIFGGVCDDTDCAHSSDINPHRSLTERLTIGFQNLFESIADKFEEGSTLNTWFTSLSSGVTNLGGNVNTWLSGLGDKINLKLGDVITKITAGLGDLGVDIDGFIDGAVSVIDGLFQKIFDFFDTFKPRVYERFRWQRGIINWNTGEVTLRDDDYPYVIVTDFFTAEPGTKVYLNYEHKPELGGLAVFQYDYYGNYIGPVYSITSSVENYELASGYLYRFRCEYPPGDTHLNNINSYVRVYCDEGWINSIIHQIEDFGTGCINLLLYFDWYGFYENPFTFSFPFIDFISDALEDFSNFLVSVFDSFADLHSYATGGYSIFTYCLEEIPYLVVIAILSLGFVAISRFLGI